MNIVDLLILAALGFAAYKGYKKGLMTALAALAGHLIGLAVAVLLSGPVARVLDGSFNLIKGTVPWLTEQLALPVSANSVKISQMPLDKAVKMINDYDLPDLFKKIMLRYVDDVAKMPVTHGINNISEAIAYLVGSFMLSSAAFLLIYGIIYHLIGKGIPRRLKKASPRPVSMLDSLAGAVLRATGTGIGIAVSLGLVMPVLSIGLFKERGSVLSAFAVLIKNSKIANAFMQGILQLIT